MTVIIRQVCATAEEVFNTLDEVEKKKKKKKKKKRGGGGGGGGTCCRHEGPCSRYVCTVTAAGELLKTSTGPSTTYRSQVQAVSTWKPYAIGNYCIDPGQRMCMESNLQ